MFFPGFGAYGTLCHMRASLNHAGGKECIPSIPNGTVDPSLPVLLTTSLDVL